MLMQHNAAITPSYTPTIILTRAGLGVLFGKLQQGVQENQQMLTIARMRAEAEDVYGQKLGDIEIASHKIEGGFSRDDGASVKKVLFASDKCISPWVGR